MWKSNLVLLALAGSCFGQSGRPNRIPQPRGADIRFTGVSVTSPSFSTNSLMFNLTATVSPITSYTFNWAPSGNPPGGVAFSNASSTNTGVTVTGNGNYDFVGRVTAGQRYAEVTVSVAVNVTSNAPPTISPIANVTTNEDFPTFTIPFTVGDDQTPAGSLTVLAVSSNPNVLPNSGISLGGSGANRTIKLTPLPNSNGVASVTVSVTDGSTSPATATATFSATWLAVNDLPQFIGVPASVIGTEDITPVVFSHTVFDVETAAGVLVETATSDNPSVVTNIVVSGAGTSSRTITVNLIPDAFGTVNIDLALTDNIATVHRVVPLTVTPVNDVPTMSSIPDALLTNGVAGQINFAITDKEDGGNMSLSRASDNPAVLPVANIVFGGSGFNRSATLTPTGIGTANVTFTATDSGGLQASSTFQVTVSGVPNTPPTLVLFPNQTTPEDNSLFLLPITVGDAETPAASLILSVVISNPALITSVALAGSGASRTCTIILVTNQFGTGTLTFTVSDGSASVTDSRTITVTPVNDAPVFTSTITSKTLQAGSTLPVTTGVSDQETAAGSLGVTATVTSGTTVSITGLANNNGAVSFTLNGSAAGANTVQVVVNDGVLTATNTFAVTVTAPPNTNPTITGLVSHQISQGGTDNQSFVIGDTESGPTLLSLAAQSSDTTLLPISNVVFGGSGANRTATVTPVGSQSGQVTVSVRVQDPQGGTASQSYILTVTPTGGRTFFAAPNGVGSASNPGTQASPWNIGSILNRATKSLVSGDDIKLLPGTYPGTYTFSGYDQAGYITIEGLNRVWGPNSGATIFDAQNATTGDASINGTAGSANRIRFKNIVGFNTALRQAWPSGNTDRRNFVYWTMHGDVQFVNNWAQDSGNCFGFEDSAAIPGGNALFYGNVGCLSGSPGTDDAHHGHICYIQSKNPNGSVTFQHNVCHNASGQGSQVRGGDEALEFFNSIFFGNVYFNNGYGGMDVKNGALAAPSPTRNFYFGGGERATNYVIVSNFTYYALPSGGPSTFLQNPSTTACNVGGGNYGPHPNYNTNLFYVGNVNIGGEFLWGRWVNAIVTNNLLIGGTRQSIVWQDRFTSGGCPLLSWSEPFDTGPLGSIENFNSIYGSTPYNSTRFGDMNLAQWRSNTGFGANDTYNGTGTISTNVIVLFPNAYDSKLGLLIIYNPSGASTVTVNLSPLLANGDSYDIYSTTSRTVRFSSGVYGGSAVIPMTGFPLTAMTGYQSGPNLGGMKSPEPYFGAFTIIKTN